MTQEGIDIAKKALNDAMDKAGVPKKSPVRDLLKDITDQMEQEQKELDKQKPIEDYERAMKGIK